MQTTIRPRRPDDVPRLVQVLVDQRETARYPYRWPLPFALEQFVVRPREETAWVAETAEDLIGQIAVLTVAENDLGRRWAEALQVPTTGLACVGSFFVDPAYRGAGAGRALLDQAVGWIQARGRVPVLDVMAHHDRARRLYQAGGWRVVGEAYPPWLPQHEPPVLLMVLDRP